MARQCPNCTAPIKLHPENGCVLNALIQVVRERRTKTERQLLRLHAKAMPDALWEDIGPLVDRLEDGKYSEV
jgi:hypothetical protein